MKWKQHVQSFLSGEAAAVTSIKHDSGCVRGNLCLMMIRPNSCWLDRESS